MKPLHSITKENAKEIKYSIYFNDLIHENIARKIKNIKQVINYQARKPNKNEIITNYWCKSLKLISDF